MPRTKKERYIFSINQADGHAILPSYKPGAREEPFLNEGMSPAEMAFLLGTPDKALVLFAGAGNDMLKVHAYSGGKTDVTGVELNPLIVNKARAMPSFGMDRFYSLPNVRMVVSEGRSFLEYTCWPWRFLVLGKLLLYLV